MNIDGKTLPQPDSVKGLVSLGLLAPSADNYQPWHFTWDGDKLTIAYDSDRVAGETFAASAPATLIAMGGVIENFSCTARACDFELATELPDTEFTSDVIAVTRCQAVNISTTFLNDNSIVKRHTNRFAYKDTPVPADTLVEITKMTRGDARVMAYSERIDKAHITQLVEGASVIRFQTKEVHEWLGASLRFTPEEVNRGDGLDVKTLDLPPGGSLFLKLTKNWNRMSKLNKIGLYKFMAKIDSSALKKAPTLLAFCGPETGLGAVQAGMLLGQVWKYLNAQGLAVHPYYVVSDQLDRERMGKVPLGLVGLAESIRRDSNRTFELSANETIHMILRIGYPREEAIRSRRLTLDKVFTDLTS